MKPFLKIIAIISIIPLLIALYFFDNIKGYYRFKHYCEKEGGLKVFEPIKKGVGLLASNKDEARAAALLENVGFVRYQEEDGNFYDIKYLGGDPQVESSFEKSPSDLLTVLNYQWKIIAANVLGELRLSTFRYEIFDVNKKVASAKYSVFSYSRFDRRKTIFDAPSSVGCFDEYGRNYRFKSRWMKDLDTAFKD